MNLANATVSQLLVPVDDLAKGVAFYRDVLGLPFLFEAPPQMAFFNCGGVRLLVAVPPSGQPALRGSATYFQVPEIAAVFSTLKSQGVSFQAEPHVVHRTPSVELWLAEFQDPFGNQLALMSEVKVGGALRSHPMKMNRLIPMLPVRSVPASVDFYEKLGFSVAQKNDGWRWAMLCFGECRLMVDESIDVRPGTPRTSILYLYPDSILEFHEQVKRNGVVVPDLETTFYGMREFRIEDPDGNRLWIGQSTSTET